MITLAEYNRWMNGRLYDAASKLPEAALHQDRLAFFGSLFNTMSHIAVADLIWLHRFAKHPGLKAVAESLRGCPSPTSLRQQLADSLPALRQLREQIDDVTLQLASVVTHDQLSQSVHYADTAGKKHGKNFGLLLLHFFNHQTHHRGQASTLLFQAGVDIGVTDLHALIASEP